MKLAVSNIVWGEVDLPGHLALLKQLGCEGVEIAPSLIWPEPIDSTLSQRRAIKQLVADHGLQIIGLHSLYYTRPDLRLCGSHESRRKMADYTKALIQLCHDLGGETLVFGSPRNRSRGNFTYEEALQLAVPFFQEVAQTAAITNTFLCIEPLAPSEADFITSSVEGAMLVKEVNHPHFCLHLDAKAMILTEEPYQEVFTTNLPYIKHFHVGDPGLAPPGSTGVDHAPLGKALRQIGYNRWISIEVKRGFGSSHQIIKQSITYTRQTYLVG